MTRILIVDDQALIRAGIRGILEADTAFQVRDVDNGLDAIRDVVDTGADVVLMDIRMPGLDGVETTRRIRRHVGSATTKILVLTTFENDETVVEAIKAGADGFIGKGVEPTELIDVVRSTAAGRSELSSNAADALVRHVSSVAASSPGVDPKATALAGLLTPRERAIVALVAAGLRNDEIAETEHISQHTVKTHVNRAMAKVGVRDRGQLVVFAFRSGIAIPR